MSLKDKAKRALGIKYFPYDFVKVTGALPAMLIYRVKRIYENDTAKKKIKGGAIIISNHISFVDPIRLHCVFWYRRLHFMAMKELFKNKFWDCFFRLVLCFPVDRDNFSMSTFNKVIEISKEKGITCIFPEGHVNYGSETVNSFKSGMILMALKSKVPIVPVYMAPRKNRWHRLKAVIGEPIDINELCGKMPSIATIEKAAEILREKELKLRKIYDDRSEKND